MDNYFIRKKIVLNSITILSFLIFIFFISHIFFGDRSIWKIFSLNSQISVANEKYKSLMKNKENIMFKINLLRDSNLDVDYITEISHQLLGLIQSDQIIINIEK